MSRIRFFDTETQTKAWYGSKASPRHPANYVVMTGWADDTQPYDGTIQGVRFEGRGKWLVIPEDITLLVMHNAPFDVDWMLAQEREEFMRFVKRGGRIFCTAYAHYLLSNQRDTYPALNDIAPQYGGTPKVDAVKLLWEQGVETSDIDPALLSEYLLGPEGDIANTRKVFYGVAQQLQERGMWEMALERMEGLLFNCFAMASGLHIDKDRAYADRDRLSAELDTLKAAFAEHRKNFPEDCEFKESSDFHMSAWLFGGPVKYRARVPATEADGSPKYVKKDAYKFGETLVLVENVPNPQVFEACVVGYGPPDRFQRGKNAGQPKLHKVATSEVQTKWGELLYQAPGIVDLKLLLQETRDSFVREFTGKRKLADESPVYSTSAECLEMLSKQSSLGDGARETLRMLLKFARIDKDLGTYYLREEVDDEGNVSKQSGMLQYMTPEGIVYHGLNATATVTTRLSGTRPNMQNLPRGDDNVYHKSEVKYMFTSRFGADGSILEADYTALEVVTLACFSQDSRLIKALLEGTDMHCLRLSVKLGESYESVLEKCHNKEHPEHKAYKQMRTDIKAPSFAYQYGATAMGIAFATGMPVDEAEAFIANEKALFPEVEAWYDNAVIRAVESSIVRKREQTDDGNWRLYGTGTWVAPGGTTYEFRQYPKSRWYQGQRIDSMEFKPTQMRNYPIQGESGFFVQGVAGMVVRWLISQDFFGGLVHVVNQVHDAIYLDVHNSVRDTVCHSIKQIMEYLPTYFSQKYGYTLNVPFPVEVEYGPNMAEKVKFKEQE